MKPTEFDRTMNILTIVLLIGVPIFLFLTWSRLPDKVPIRYDFSGNVTGWGGKGSLFIWPIVGIVFYIILSFVEHMPPEQWNTGVKITSQNKEWVYKNIRHSLSTMKLLFAVLMSVITLTMAAGRRLSLWVIGLEILIITVNTVFWLVRASRGKR